MSEAQRGMKARQTEILNSVEMIGKEQASELVSLPGASLAEALCFDIDDKTAYPLFQFEISKRQIYPVMLEVMAMRSDDWGGKIALLQWLTTLNRSLGDMRPCDCLADKPQMIVASFEAEITQQMHG